MGAEVGAEVGAEEEEDGGGQGGSEKTQLEGKNVCGTVLFLWIVFFLFFILLLLCSSLLWLRGNGARELYPVLFRHCTVR